MANIIPGLNLGLVEQALRDLNRVLGNMSAGLTAGSFTVALSPVNSTAFAASQVSVGTTAGGTAIAAANSARKYLAIRNIGSNPVFIGASGVTTATGYSLATGATLEMKETVTTAAVYGIVAASTETVSVLEW